MTNVPFTIEINNKSYKGFLQTTDIADLPKTFFVFIDNYIVGDLLFRYGEWVFDQGGRHKILGKLSDEECKRIAEYLGEIAAAGYDSQA